MAEGGELPKDLRSASGGVDEPITGGESKVKDKDLRPPEDASKSTSDDDLEDSKSRLDKLGELFKRTLGFSSSDNVDDPAWKTSILSELSLSGVAEFIASEKCKNIVVMAGAGISTSAGIPDFRSPGSGLYSKLDKYYLPSPECIFEISYFKMDPRPFYSLAKELLPGRYKPTPCHFFLRLLHEKLGSLLRIYTQNVDGLERIAGVPSDKIVEAHGTFHTSHCLKCNAEYALDWMKERILADETPTCTECKSYVKPDVVFFGENLPQRFFSLCAQDFEKCDFLLILGTSLAVQPFASLVDRVPKTTPRLLINKEKTGSELTLRLLGYDIGLDFDSKRNRRDVAWLGMCDEGCQQLADLLGFGDELRRTLKEEHADEVKEPAEDENISSATST